MCVNQKWQILRAFKVKTKLTSSSITLKEKLLNSVTNGLQTEGNEENKKLRKFILWCCKALRRSLVNTDFFSVSRKFTAQRRWFERNATHCWLKNLKFYLWYINSDLNNKFSFLTSKIYVSREIYSCVFLLAICFTQLMSDVG